MFRGDNHSPILDAKIPGHDIVSVHVAHHYRELVDMNLPFDKIVGESLRIAIQAASKCNETHHTIYEPPDSFFKLDSLEITLEMQEGS